VWFTRIFGLAGRAALPDYFEIVEDPRVVAVPESGTVPESAPAPLRRTAARVVLLDDADRVLLLSGTDPQVDSRWWITPGGGVEAGEELAGAALRELTEETGLRVADDRLIGPIWHREAQFTFTGIDYVQTEYYFVARAPQLTGPSAPADSVPTPVRLAPEMPSHAPAGAPDSGTGNRASTAAGILLAEQPADSWASGAELDISGHTDLERLTLTGHRWWSLQALAETQELVYPVQLAQRWPEVVAALRSGAAPEPVPTVD
jgi:8-oxo-dGTP pyrophosphatase MutT (NUDIX family)